MKGDSLGAVEVGDEIVFQIAGEGADGVRGPFEVVDHRPTREDESEVRLKDGDDIVRVVGDSTGAPTVSVLPDGEQVGEAFVGFLSRVEVRK